MTVFRILDFTISERVIHFWNFGFLVYLPGARSFPSNVNFCNIDKF